MFHLMTHAFFKALLFMAAGSVIAAMAGTQDLDKMGGFRKAMPYTYGCMVIGGLALAGIPPFSGFFSKDEILALLIERGDWHVGLAIAGYIGALLTAIYTFRMIFRAFSGDPCPEARELEGGHLHHAPEHTNPATGEVEDTDVGFPGADHHIAEREGTMKIAMGGLAILATVGGVVQIPKVNESLHHFLDPTFHDSRFYEELEPSGGLVLIGMVVGAALGLLGIFIAYTLWVKQPERPAAIRARFSALHRFFSNKWYFDEAIDTRDRAPHRLGRPLLQLHDRARPRQRRARRRHVRRRARRVRGRARDPDGLPALLRRAAAGRPHRPRRLLPDLRMTDPPEHPHLRAARVRRRSARSCRAARRRCSRSSARSCRSATRS